MFQIFKLQLNKYNTTIYSDKTQHTKYLELIDEKIFYSDRLSVEEWEQTFNDFENRCMNSLNHYKNEDLSLDEYSRIVMCIYETLPSTDGYKPIAYLDPLKLSFDKNFNYIINLGDWKRY